LKPLHFLLELLIAILQLLDRAGEIADLGFEVIDTRHQVGVGGLCVGGAGP